VVEGLAAGGVDYVVKPIVVEELLARIRVPLAQSRAANGSRAALDASGRYPFGTDRRRTAALVQRPGPELLLEAYPGRSETEHSLPGSTGRATAAPARQMPDGRPSGDHRRR